jgi:hypothetical protein
VCLTASQTEPHRQTIAVQNDMDLTGQPAPRATNVLAVVIGDAGTMLVHDGRVDHLHRCIICHRYASMIRSQTPARRQRTKRL